MSPGVIPPSPFHTLPAAVQDAWRLVARLPFENLTKVIKFHAQDGVAARAIRLPEEVLHDHEKYGTGATCFGLVYLLRDLLRRHGFEGTLHLCDRRYGADTHAALLFTWEGMAWTFDPGYRVVQPLPDSGTAAFLSPTNPNACRVKRVAATRYQCFTGHAGDWHMRFVLKSEPASEEDYRAAWCKTFELEAMGYPVITRFEDGRMIYLQKSNLVVRDVREGGMVRLKAGELPDEIQRHYGIAPEIARRALKLM